MTGYLSTRGNQIVDATGTPFQIRGVNWSGFETPRFCPDGLHLRNYRDVIDQMAGLGFNTLRIPLSNALLEPGRVPSEGSIDTWNANKDLAGLTSLQILDSIIAHAGSVG